MNKDFIIDYLIYILFRFFGFLIRHLPVTLSLFFGRRLGELLYCLDLRHKAIAYANIKKALGSELPPSELSGLTLEFYRTFGQSLIEIFLIPSFDKEYIDKYVIFEGLDNIKRGFKLGKGVIFLGVHEGSWELSNIIAANLGFPFKILVRNQKRFPRVERLLNLYRTQRGCKIIQREIQTRQLIETLKANEGIGMSVDQGGKAGERVKFFGYNASMSTGAIRMALRYGAVIVPTFFTRIKGARIKIIIKEPFEVINTGNPEKDIHDNLQKIISIFEGLIRLYPKEYLWTYKLWKNSDEKDILILSDGRTGHLRQAQAVAKIANDSLRERGIHAQSKIVDVKFKNRFSRGALTFSSCLADRYHCQGCLRCLRVFLTSEVYARLVNTSPDIIISCGSSVAPINYILSRENRAKSVVIMRPSLLNLKRFDLAIMQKHDNPPKKKNVVATVGALNLIDEDYLKEQGQGLIRAMSYAPGAGGLNIGFLIGGDTKDFKLDTEAVTRVIKELKSACENLDANILITTSRRTPVCVERLVREEFAGYPRCKLLVIANEKNVPEAVGGILGLSNIIVTSPESISMISEAVNSKKYVLVFDLPGIRNKHRSFLEYFAQKKYVYLFDSSVNWSREIERILKVKPQIGVLPDAFLVREAIEKIL